MVHNNIMSNAKPAAIELRIGTLGTFTLPFCKQGGITTKWEAEKNGTRVTVYKRGGIYTAWLSVMSGKTGRWAITFRHTNKALPALGYELAWKIFDAKRKAAA